MTVGLYSPGWPPSGFANGIVTYVEAVAGGMIRLGHRPVVLAGRVVEEGSAGGGRVPVIDLRPFCEPSVGARLVDRIVDRVRRPSHPIGIRRLAKGIARFTRGAGRLDVLEIEETFGLPGLVAGRVSVPVVARLHGPWFLNGPNQGGDPASQEFVGRVREEGLGIASVNGITAPSRDVLERFRSYYGLALEGAEVIPNTTPSVPEGLRWRPEGCEPDRILFIGRFDLHKGGDTIIDAFALLHRDRPSARLTFVGPDRGLVRDGRRWNLEAYVESRMPGALRDGRVEWLGPRPNAELNALRSRAAVTVCPSRDENFPMAIIEALAVGCPLVAARAGGAAEAFDHGMHGLYFDPADPDGLASALAELLADPVRAAELGRAASAHCERRYSPEAVASRTIDSYRRVVGSPGRRLLTKESRS